MIIIAGSLLDFIQLYLNQTTISVKKYLAKEFYKNIYPNLVCIVEPLFGLD
jgi:hypothetical protein